MIDYRTRIEHAVTRGWESGTKVGIIFQVTLNGQYIEGVTFPTGKDTLKTVAGENAVVINLSLSACKMFNYVGEYKQFVYDVSVGGKQFFGNIIPETVIDVVNLDTGESFYQDIEDEPTSSDEAMVEVPAHNFTRARLVADNPHIVPSISTAKLKVVH